MSLLDQLFAWLGRRIERPIQDLPPVPVLIHLRLQDIRIENGDVDLPATVDFPPREGK